MKRLAIPLLIVCALLGATANSRAASQPQSRLASAGMPSATPLEMRMILAARAYWTSRIGYQSCSNDTGEWICSTRPVMPACGQPIIRRVWGTGGYRSVQPDSWAYVLHRNVSSCVIDLVSIDWSRAAEREHYPLYCRMMAHEYGHLLGFWDEGRSGMYAHYISDRVPDRYCSLHGSIPSAG